METTPSLDARLEELSGTELGPYRLVRILGRGAMAVVFLAEQRSLGRFVALKILRPSLAVDENYVQRFLREARSAAALLHPNIVQIYEVGHAGNLHYIAQEYVAGRNLKQILAQALTFGPSEVLAILKQVAAALSKAQEARIVHRDIKPENILLGDDGLVKVADFGLARIACDREQQELTRVGFTMGTPLYMSPEQVEGKPVDARSDIYSLGITAYQMLTGRPPFDGENPFSIAVQHVKGTPPSLAAARPNLPPALVRTIESMLAKDREARPAHGAELLTQLNAIALDAGGSGSARTTMVAPWLSGSSGTLQATKQLAALMGPISDSARDLSRARSNRWRRALFVPIFLAGTAIAALTGPGDPLQNPRRDRTTVDDFGSAANQWTYADMVDTEAGWRSVLEHYPANKAPTAAERTYAWDATGELARWYYEHDRPELAIPLYAMLTQLESTEGRYLAQGYAGLVISHVSRKDWNSAAEALARLKTYESFLAPESSGDFLPKELAVARARLTLERGTR